ncbi:MAG TPA: aminoglycoside phosphotransferase family protein [Candidatus Babeliales bacterium]|nr:aminoglycoside phosphotransferase family protein [Candidatus Babeliales bacterium]
MSTLEKNVVQAWGAQGKEWLKNLPTIVEALAVKWQLTDLTPFRNLSYNYVLKGFQHKKPIVVKLGFDSIAIKQEGLTLDTYKGSGSVRLLDADLSMNALLIEHAISGTTLKSFFAHRDDQAIAHTVSVIKRLHTIPVAEPSLFPDLPEWLKALENPHPALSTIHINKARELSSSLLATQKEKVLLHGDLHHENIVSSARDSWLAIDPKGIWGDPTYEVGAFIRNPFPELLHQQNLNDIIARRITLFAQHLNFDRQRIQEWAYVQAVLAACWAMEDGETDPNYAMIEAEILEIK